MRKGGWQNSDKERSLPNVVSGARRQHRRPPPRITVIATQQVVRQTRRASSRLVVFHLSPRSVNNKQPNREAIKPSEHANCMYAQCSEDFSIDVTPTRLPRSRAPAVCTVEQLNFTAITQEINLLHKFENLEGFEDFPYEFERTDRNGQGHDESGVATLGGTDVLPCLLCIFHL